MRSGAPAHAQGGRVARRLIASGCTVDGGRGCLIVVEQEDLEKWERDALDLRQGVVREVEHLSRPARG